MASLPSQSGKLVRPGKGRGRRGVRKASDPVGRRLARLAEHPSAGWGLIISVAFILVVGSLVAWTREQPQLVANRTARSTRTVRVEFDAPNAAQTAQKQENARQNTPRVYRAIDTTIDSIIGEIERLPSTATMAGPGSSDSAAQSLLTSLNLSAETVSALAAVGADPAALSQWTQKTAAFRDILLRNPLLQRADWERARTEGLSRRLELAWGAGGEMVVREQVVNIGDTSAYRDQISKLAGNARFEGPPAEAVVAVMLARSEPTYSFDAATTTERQDVAAEQVQTVVDKRAIGQTIFTRGDIITPTQLLMYEQEMEQYRLRAAPSTLWGRRLGIIAIVGVCTVALGIALATLSPRTATKPSRLGWIAGLLALAVTTAAIGTLVDPAFIALASTAPVALLAVLMVTVYDRLVATVVGLIAALLVSLALTPMRGYVVINLIGIAAVLWSLPEIRDRGSIVAMSLWAMLALGLATAFDGLASLPLDAARVSEILADAATAGFGGLLVGGVTLFVLPGIERAFNITTGMTLVELRDPKQVLLRELQQRAPGTYNHSLNVATIAESAAASIDANTLLTYAGALYHDIGKMTKPEYFVENQSGGSNKHDRLSPAMSVLVIIGHVKDGLELAREYGLPRPLHHFIEAHHGTTLVEYFYHRAKQKAEGGEEEQAPAEFDYRYPGPKPRTKEAAILMLADSVESATRTLREPTPSRIESLVQQLANKRLMDGQFDECDLTLRELHKVVESISKSVASIYHGRVSYPGDKDKKPEAAQEKSA
ncbi:MAG: HDIG domain-containing protein [Phycisphaeraceae bacterium]|nr:MAG: HDIG domain-containing protein [Phycisphaeraceae bacterium]